MIYTVTFNPAIDYAVHPKVMKIGGINRSEKEEMYLGGKGINVSIVLKEPGVKSIALNFTAGILTGDYQYALKTGTAAGGAAAFSEELASKERIEELLKTLG